MNEEEEKKTEREAHGDSDGDYERLHIKISNTLVCFHCTQFL